MSGLEEQINKINKSIQEKTTELNALQSNLRKMPYQNRIKHPDLKKQKLLSNQINSLTQNLNTLQNLQGEIVKQQRITNSLNRNVPSDKDVNKDSKKLGIDSDEELLKELEAADNEEEDDEEKEGMGQPVKEEESGVKPVEEEQKVQLPGNTIPTPDENYIKRPSTEEEGRGVRGVPVEEEGEGKIDDEFNVNDEYIKKSEEEERGVKPVVEEERGIKSVKVPKYKQGKFVLENKSQNPTPEDEEDLYSSGITRKNAGFSETIVPRINGSTGPKRPNMKLCPQIFDIGKKVNNKFFIPSQFPNLTKKKSLLKGGRKHMKTKNRNRKVISRSRKGISRKGISKNKRKSVKNLALYSNLYRHKLM